MERGQRPGIAALSVRTRRVVDQLDRGHPELAVDRLEAEPEVPIVGRADRSLAVPEGPDHVVDLGHEDLGLRDQIDRALRARIAIAIGVDAPPTTEATPLAHIESISDLDRTGTGAVAFGALDFERRADRSEFESTASAA